MKRVHVSIKVPYEGRQFNSISYFYEDDVAEGETPEQAFARVRAVVEAQARSEGPTQTSGAQLPPAPRDSGRGPSPQNEIFDGRPDQRRVLMKPFEDRRIRVSDKWRQRLDKEMDGKTMAECDKIVKDAINWYVTRPPKDSYG